MLRIPQNKEFRHQEFESEMNKTFGIKKIDLNLVYYRKEVPFFSITLLKESR